MTDDAARVEAERRDFKWEVFVASDGIKSIRQSGMTHEDAFVAGAAWQAAQDQAELATWQKIANEQEDQIEAYRAETASLIQAAQPVVVTAEQRALIASVVRRNCTPSGEAYAAGGDRLIYAVADWIENPPEWVTFS